jgi:hypothetical protein
MELGIGPLVTASMIMQLLSGTKIISIDQNDKDERKKFKCVEKCKSIFICIDDEKRNPFLSFAVFVSRMTMSTKPSLPWMSDASLSLSKY